MTHTIESISNDSRNMSETNDCTVRALVATTGRSYEDCHAALKAEGRKNRKGAYRHQWEKAANRLGFTFVDVTRNNPGRTIRTATRYLPRGRKFIMQVRGHVAGFDGVNVLDWAKGRQHRIQNIVEVIAAENVEPVIVKGYNDVVVPAPVRRRRNVNINFVAIEKPNFDNRFNVVVPPARVNREKWARENALHVCAHGQIGVIELKGDAAVAYRKANNVRGKVFMTFSFQTA